jgi:thioredoxin reductase (NADPH)
MENKIYDVIILGAGPAGLAAGLYAGRAKLSVLIIEKGIDGGQIMLTHEISNYPGQSRIDGESGQELIAPMSAQCAKFGCERVCDTVSGCDFGGTVKKLVGEKGEYMAYSVIICAGAMTRFIGCINETKFVGRGVSYCAVCDANFFEGLEIYTVGGSETAVKEALYLAKFARKLTILHKGSKLNITAATRRELEANSKIGVMLDTEVTELGGDDVLSEIILRNTVSGEKFIVHADENDGFFGLFCFTGKKTTGMFEGLLDMEEKTGYIRTNEKMETNIAGVYAAGDVRVTPLRQVVTACADGAIAATQCERYVERLKSSASGK